MRSMTGCGKCRLSDERYEVTVELKSVNHRFLDLSIRLPRQLNFLEPVLRESISGLLKRGHVEVFLTVRSLNESSKTVQTDTALAAIYLNAAKAIAEASGAVQDVTVSSLMGMDGVLTVTDSGLDEDAVSALTASAARQAAEQVVVMREAEGSALQSDLSTHLEAAVQIRDEILSRAPGVVDDYRARLNARLAQLLESPVDPARLAQEVALIADKCAIDEELSRLESHVQQMRIYLNARG